MCRRIAGYVCQNVEGEMTKTTKLDCVLDAVFQPIVR